MKTIEPLIIGGLEIHNRFFLGSGKFSKKADFKQAIIESGIEVVTVAMRRIDMDRHQENILEYIPPKTILMVNTSGARNAREAIQIAHLAREAGDIRWIKIEVMNDSKYLLPDNQETIEAVRVLAADGFTVLPYMFPDLYAAQALQQAGAAAVMPLGSLIGSCQGLQAKTFIQILIAEIDLPVIVDAGIGSPSQAAQAMEIGASAVLANTAVAIAHDPVSICHAFSLAVKAGRLAYLGNAQTFQPTAQASSPLTDFLFD